ncbi:hypothetical protein [Sphingomonas abaci]|uniref:Uncharacterized protein n=1 Tax=Sphingomonas abaci TaxID=237611 RepID=A0A7W7AMZ4_9SPHN|nr:hypothetical protein [Sphingomonas abaci]MBB4619975.1 hypothetical protein [Sphingomonas abaci]
MQRDLTYAYDTCPAKRAGGFACVRDDGHHGPHYYRDHQGRRPPSPRPPGIDKREADPRKALAAIMASQGDRVTLAALSRMLDRPSNYLGRFVADGVPAALRPDEHARLANFFGLDQRALGVRDLWRRA